MHPIVGAWYREYRGCLKKYIGRIENTDIHIYQSEPGQYYARDPNLMKFIREPDEVEEPQKSSHPTVDASVDPNEPITTKQLFEIAEVEGKLVTSPLNFHRHYLQRNEVFAILDCRYPMPGGDVAVNAETLKWFARQPQPNKYVVCSNWKRVGLKEELVWTRAVPLSYFDNATCFDGPKGGYYLIEPPFGEPTKFYE